MRQYGVWKVTLPADDGSVEEYLFELDELTGAECLAIEQELADTEWEVSFDRWVFGVSRARWVPCQVLIWFLRTKAGQSGERLDVNFALRKLEIVVQPVPKEGDTEPSARDGSSPSPVSELVRATSIS